MLRSSARTASNREKNCDPWNGTTVRINAIATTTKTTTTAAIATSGTYHRDGSYAHTHTHTAHAHAQRVGRHARTHQSHGPTRKHDTLCYVVGTTTTGLKQRCNYNTTITAAVLSWLLTVAARRPPSSFRDGTGGAVSEIPSRWRHRRRTADFARWSARAPRAVRPPTLRAAQSGLPLTTRSTYILWKGFHQMYADVYAHRRCH